MDRQTALLQTRSTDRKAYFVPARRLNFTIPCVSSHNVPLSPSSGDAVSHWLPASPARSRIAIFAVLTGTGAPGHGAKVAPRTTPRISSHSCSSKAKKFAIDVVERKGHEEDCDQHDHARLSKASPQSPAAIGTHSDIKSRGAVMPCYWAGRLRFGRQSRSSPRPGRT